MKENRPNVAVIGCGYWGRNIVRNFAELGALKAISDPSAENAAGMSSAYSVPALSLEEILSDAEIEGVAIAAPAVLHAELARQCLLAGKHVMVEKPVALSLEDARMMIDLAAEQERLLMVGHLLNYHAGFLKVVSLVEQGAAGSLQRIYSNRLSLGKLRTEENVLWSFAPHDISMILRLAGGTSPASVDAHGASCISEGVEDFANVHLGFEGGLTAHIFVSWLHPFKEQRLVVIGNDAMIVFDDTQPLERKVAIYRHKAGIDDGLPFVEKAEAEYVELPASEPLKMECQAFIDGMEDPRQIYTDGEEGWRVLDVLSRAEAAMKARSGA